MVYIALVLREGYKGKPTQEFITSSNSRLDACIALYGYKIDGCRTDLLAFNPMTGRKIYDHWESDPIFFATVKSEFLSRRRIESEQASLKQKTNSALRPEDV